MLTNNQLKLNSNECKYEDYSPKKTNRCKTFNRCASGKNFEFACPVGTKFSEIYKICDFEANIKC